MMRFKALSIAAAVVLILGLASVALGYREQVRPLQPPGRAVGDLPYASPFIMVQQGDTTWLQVHTDNSRCPGDPSRGHGGEGTGGSDGSETWCLEQGVGDTCGTVAPWTTNCFKYVDVRSLPSQVGINYWHVDSYRTDQRTYTGSRALWCGSGATWQGKPVECGTWINPPGYGAYWNCVVQLSLPADFDVAAGCTLYFDPRYDTECKYDYYYVDYLTQGAAPTYLQTWKQLALFNGTSNTSNTTCGDVSKPNPDHFGNGDARGVAGANCNWEERSVSGQPAFKAVITQAMLGTLSTAPKFRWRFYSDGAWCDADGSGDSDGAAYLDNVWVVGDPGDSYAQDFEACSVNGPLPQYWSLENPPGVAQCWHIVHDPDPPYEGGDGGDRTTCLLDSSWVWRGRPDIGYKAGMAWRNGWFYRLMSPKVEIQNTGCVVDYDQFMCALDYTCDYTDTKVRFFDGVNQMWCPWVNIDNYILTGGCFFWNFNFTEDVTAFYGGDADSMQFCWELIDVSSPGDVCRGKHQSTENIIDNVSIGFYDGNAAQFVWREIDFLHDSMIPSIAQGFNSQFNVYSPDSIARYSGPSAAPIPKTQQLVLDVTDKDTLASVVIVGSITKGTAWVNVPMTLRVPADPLHPELGGEYYGTLKAGDFIPGATSWPVGTECWYYVKATDELGNHGYWPARANPADPEHDGTRDDYWEFTILPMFPETYTGVKILLVDGMCFNVYNYGQCVGVLNRFGPLEDIYEQVLQDAGYCFDKFDIEGSGSNVHIHPTIFQDYDAVVWFTGPYFSDYRFDKEAQIAIRSYLNEGGKFVFCGDRIAYDMAVVGEDSLGGEFLGGILGASYQEEMESAFTKPYQYVEAVPAVSVFGAPVAIPLDTMVVYRECPYLKDMSYVITKSPPWTGYTAQPLLQVLNPGPNFTASDAGIYTEYQGRGQAVYINFDLSAAATHMATYCSGTTPTPAPDFDPGYYYGRVDLLKAILFNIFGLPAAGGAGVIEPPAAVYQWALGQSSPNPLAGRAEIRFEVAKTSNVSLKVYNAMGQVVRVLKNERMEPGRHAVSWDGTNQAGDRVSSGVYFYSMEAGSFKATKKMLVVK